MTSSYQMAVLLQYNENDRLSLAELVAATGIGKEYLAQVLEGGDSCQQGDRVV